MMAQCLAQRLTGRVKAVGRRFAHSRSGATAIEYALIAALISIAIVSAASALGSSLSNEWLYIANIVSSSINH